MKELSGFDNEFIFVKNLNGKTIQELNPLLRELIYYLFYDIKNDDIIKCWRNHYPQKADILIKVKNHIRGVSIKKGMKNSVHVDCISEFIHFLIDNKVPRHIIIKYLKYQYADGTTNGSGRKRLSVEEYKKMVRNGVNNAKTYNKIWSPGRRIHKDLFGFLLD